MNINKSSHHNLHSFCIRPATRFLEQTKGEEVILQLRAHPITQIGWMLNGLILFTVLVFVNWVFGSALTGTQVFLLNLLSFTLILAYLWFNFLTYYFNIGLVTTKRIVDMDYHNVMFREFSETHFDKIEDVTATSSGYFASLFNFGDVFVQTAGTNINIQFLKVPRPSEVVSLVNELAK